MRAFNWAFVFCAAFLAAPYAWARYYHHHHHNELFDAYFRWVFAHPTLGWPLTAVLTALFIKLSHKGGTTGYETYQQSVIKRGLEAQDKGLLSEGIVRLKAKDPSFDLAAFQARAEESFLAVQRAWSGQDMSKARACISDGILERFTLQAQRQAEQGLRNVVEDAEVYDCAVLQAETGRGYDALHVRIRASASDKDLSVPDGRLLRGGEREEFEEVWSFTRRAGQKDWVVSAITQACEWAPRPPDSGVEGLERFPEGDPEINAAYLEDRASAAFWRWQHVLFKADPAVMKPLASDACLAALDAQLRELPGFYEGVSISGVELLALEPGSPWDRAHVLVKWSGDRWEVRDGRPAERGPAFRGTAQLDSAYSCVGHAALQHVFVFERESEGGNRSWTLCAALPIGRWKAPGRAAEAPPLDSAWAASLSPADAVAVMAAAMTADGVMDPKERAYLQSYAEKQGVGQEKVDRLVAAAQARQILIPRPKTAAEAEACMRGLITMSLADGRITQSETNLLLSFGGKLALAPAQVYAMVREERAALYRKAKAFL